MDPTYPKWSPQSLLQNRKTSLWLTALAAFCAYFCMFGFRKPFAASTYDGVTAFGIDLKSSLVLAQLLGYMTSKFIGIKVISEMPAHRRAWTIIGLIGLAELALIGFAVLPVPFKVLMLFLNGLPLGMIDRNGSVHFRRSARLAVELARSHWKMLARVDEPVDE